MKPIPQYNIRQLQRLFRKDDVPHDYFFVREDSFNLYESEPFRTETFAIAFLRKGTFVVQGGLERSELVAPCLFALGPHVIRQFDRADQEPLLEIIFFTGKFFLNDLSDVFFLSKFPFFEQNQPCFAQLDQTREKQFIALYEQIQAVLSEKHPHESQLIRSYINILIHEFDAELGSRTVNVTEDHGTPALVANFKTLLVREFKDQRTVGYYAEKLNVTAKHLSELLKEKTGRSASQWINEAIILEAKVLLQRSDYTVAKVSEQLNFSDQSVFGKFFKANTNMSPASYKKSATHS
ncbi:AraC-type DNA-binding protein [Dyadobacter sp. SG02]|uniref:helix-turn-helix domain-containing protein n=1 Tax=Dyadobacter sp. SG02 TaxID=1855291 RepID=UPI0008BBF98D|nr:helix-turn-helix domain-containing protein [Dyadobacter sp. SG02]SEJ59856.1 AraC-type DNA-binding protein [Dyadobacter sp. SG02]